MQFYCEKHSEHVKRPGVKNVAKAAQLPHSRQLTTY